MALERLVVERFAHRVAEIAQRHRDVDAAAVGFATVERIIFGPTTRADASWLVVLYRSSAVTDGQQLIGFGIYISETRNAALTAEQFERTSPINGRSVCLHRWRTRLT